MLKTENMPGNPLVSHYEEVYEYDIDNPTKYGTKNNRLMKIERWRIERTVPQQSASFSEPTAGDTLAEIVPFVVEV